MLAMLLTPAALFADPSVERVIVRQQWPWSTDVKVEYSLSGVGAAHPVDISVRAFNDGVELPSANLNAAITGERYSVTSAVGSFTIDPVAAFGTEQVALGSFTVQLSLSATATNMGEVLYKVFDIATGACEKNITRAELLNGKYGAVETDFSRIGDGFNTTLDDVIIWTGVTNYPGAKTTKLVMRKIPVGGKQCVVGCPTTEMGYNNSTDDRTPQETITMPEDYWIGVFELTVGQCLGLKPGLSSKVTFKNEDCYNERPMHKLPWTSIRCFNANTFSEDVHAESVIGILRSRTGLSGWELPNTNEWEVACRAGTTTGLNSGKNLTARSASCPNLNEVARYYYNAGTTAEGYSAATCDATQGLAPVGTYAPNAYGLYDMHGNVLEWTVNWKPRDSTIMPASGWFKGGSFNDSAIRAVRSAFKANSEPCSYDTLRNGCRLLLKLSE